MAPTTLDTVTALVDRSEGRFDAELSPEWTINGKPNGGYLLALLGRAAAISGSHEHVIAASAHYLHSPDPGPATIDVEVLRAGRSASQLRARLSQDDTACVEALLTTSRLDTDTVPYWNRGLPAPNIAGWEDCIRVPPLAPNGMAAAIMGQVEVRLDPAILGFANGQPTGRGELRGWLALPDGQPFDHSALLYAVDALPPATFNIETSGWVPTLELTAYVRALPVPGPVQIRQSAGLIDAQRVDETCLVWDRAGRLVAQGTQLAGIRLGR